METTSAVAGSGHSGSGFLQIAAAVLIVTLMAAGAGALAGRMPSLATQPLREAAKVKAPTGIANVAMLDLPPVVTNLSSPKDVWIRLETSMIFNRRLVAHPDAMSAVIAGDFLAYLRTLKLEQIQGPTGFENLREDLNERASTRSKGAVREVVIRTMVVQ